MIVVIDTSVWISALQFAIKRGTPRDAIVWASKIDKIATCSQIEDEIRTILVDRFDWSLAAVSEALGAVCPFPLRVEIDGHLHVCRDPNDDMILECAVLASAQVIMTGDKDLLVLDPYKEIRILSPAAYVEDAQRRILGSGSKPG